MSQGPCVAVDTACSSALTAGAAALRALYAGDCGSAIVGGVNLVLTPEVTITFAHAGMLSMDGRCKVR